MADFTGTTGNDSYAGTAADDTIHDGGGGSDNLAGDAGNDLITVTGGNDAVDGGSGSDRLTLLISGTVSPTGLGLSTLNGDFANGYSGLFDGASTNNTSFSGIEHFTVTYTGSGAVNILTGDGDDSLTGGSGADNLRSGGGIDTIDGGAGLDRWGADLTSATDNIVIDLNAATSTYLGTGSVTGIEGFNSLLTGSGDDEITGTAAALVDVVKTGAGQDTITLFGLGNDVVDGGADRDRLVVNFHSSMSLGSIGGSFEAGYSGTMDGVGTENVGFAGIEDFTITMTGASVLNVLTGGGDDVLIGGDGADTLRSGAGIDSIDGGAGIDRWGADMSSATDDIVIDLNAPSSTFLGTGSVTNVEGFVSLLTGAGEDRITGTQAAISETVNAGDGDDIITLSGQGSDNAAGGAGTDRLVVESTHTSVGLSTPSGSLATGYSGYFDGPSTNNVVFSGIENFTFNLTGAGFSTIRTGDGEDVLNGGGGGDDFIGGGGDDRLDGRDGSDSVLGGDGDDTIIASLGIDTVGGGNGADVLVIDYSAAAAAIISGAYTPTVGGGFSGALSNPSDGSSVSFTGIEAFDIRSGSANDSVVGADGDDTLSGGAGNDTLTGGLGSDTASYKDLGGRITASLATGVVTSVSGNGTDSLTSIENLIGTSFSDALTGNGDANSLNGGDGADTIEGGEGNDTLAGGNGTDTASYAGSLSGVTVALAAGAQDTGGAGTDVLSGFERLVGSALADRLNGDSNANSLSGGNGADTLIGGLGSDTLNGGGGMDIASYADSGAGIIASLTSGSVSGGADADTLVQIEGLIGSAFADRLTGSSGDDVLEGGDGRDTLAGGAGNDQLSGDKGHNVASYAGATSGVTVRLALTSAQETGGAGIDTLSQIADILGSAHADSLYGNLRDNLLTGDDGADLLVGAAGDDKLLGGDGNDTLDGGAGDDVLNGGTGRNLAAYASAAAAVAVDLSIRSAQDTGGGGLDTLFRIQDLEGSAFDDVLEADDRANIVDGGDGADTLDGAGGRDLLRGESGNDRLLGGAKVDTLDGGLHNDTLIGGAGIDLLTGGGGQDVFIFDTMEAKSDRITDLTNQDTIDLHLLDANSTVGGNQAFELVSSFHHTAGEARLVYREATDTTQLQLDTDGDNRADMTITLDGDQTGFSAFVL
jgi:Ca2+-binding RTX toxin-like protein